MAEGQAIIIKEGIQMEKKQAMKKQKPTRARAVDDSGMRVVKVGVFSVYMRK